MKPEVSLGVYYNVGSKYEEIGQKGLNRILGNVYQNIRKENYEKTDLKTDYAKAYFLKDITGFVNEIDKKRLHSALKIEADLMQTYVNNINEDIIDKSKNIIKQKIKDLNSNPIGRYSFSILPEDHPYYHSVLGLENQSGYGIFLHSIKFSFYPLMAMFFVIQNNKKKLVIKLNQVMRFLLNSNMRCMIKTYTLKIYP